MKSRPILFSAPMVRALLDGTKTQTRRVVSKNDAALLEFLAEDTDQLGQKNEDGGTRVWCDDYPEEGSDVLKSRYGQIGDQLWVKENWKIANWNDDGDIDVFYLAQPSEFQHWVEIGILEDAKGNAVFERLWQQSTDDCLKAGLKTLNNGQFNFEGKVPPTRNRPSIFMPRAASRITLEITGVRVERLQDITRGDCMAEGCPFPNISKETNPKDWYSDLWKTINGADSWDKNPWVWVIKFKKVTT